MRITETQESEAFATTHEWLRTHNAAHVSKDWIPVRFLAHDDKEQLVGSLDAEVFWGKLHVSNVVVAPDQQRRGVGTQLMEAAQDAATRNSCSGIYLETMSFQSLDFYLHLGFKKVGELEGFENESTMYFLHKAV